MGEHDSVMEYELTQEFDEQHPVSLAPVVN